MGAKIIKDLYNKWVINTPSTLNTICKYDTADIHEVYQSVNELFLISNPICWDLSWQFHFITAGSKFVLDILCGTIICMVTKTN